MILISVKSEVVEDKRQFTSDKKALAYLRAINTLHHTHRKNIAGPKPKRMGKQTRRAVKKWREVLATCVNLKVEIINTKQNQLSLSL